LKIKKFEYSKSFLRLVRKELEQLDRFIKQLEERERQVLVEQEALREELRRINEQLAALDRIIEDGSSTILLSGQDIPKVAIQIMLKQHNPRQHLHYRDWYLMVLQAGYYISGEKPLNNFLTNFARSPLVRRIENESGIYAIDFLASSRIQCELEEAEAELKDMKKAASKPQFTRVSDPEIYELELRIRRLRRNAESAEALTRVSGSK
jgi:hypothetical protein